MSDEKEWFSGLHAEDRKMLSLKVLKWLVLAGIVLLAFAGLSGCATTATAPEPQMSVCFMKLMGMTEDGTTVVAQSCMSPEAFAETQR